MVSNPDNLGHLLGEFGWNKGRAKAVLWIWIGLLFPSLLFSLVLIGLPGLFLSIYFIYRSITRLRSTRPAIALYGQALVDQRKGTPVVIPYEAIKQTFISATVINGVLNYIVTLELQTGQKIKLDEHIANVDNLRKILEEQLIREQLPGAIALYNQGNPVNFGNLQVNQAGLSLNGKTLPWAEFESAEVEKVSNNVYLTIRQKDNSKEWGMQPRDTFPNLALFFALIHQIQSKFQ